MRIISIEADVQSAVASLPVALTELTMRMDQNSPVRIVLMLTLTSDISKQNRKLDAVLVEMFRHLGVTTQKECARIVGVSQSTLSKVMRSKRLPRKLFLKIKEAAGASAETELLHQQLEQFVLKTDKVRW